MSASTRPPTAVTAYVTAWIVASAVVMAPAAISLVSEPINVSRILTLIGIVAAAELIELHFRFSQRMTSAFTLIEAAVAAVLLLAGPAEAVLTVGAGALVANVLRRRRALKAGFNTAQVTTSTFAAAVIMTVLPPIGPVVGQGAIGTLAIAMAAYGLVNLAALTGLLRLLSVDVLGTLRNQWWLTAAQLLGGLPIGVLGAELSGHRPELVALLVAPAASVFLAYRGVARTQELLGQVRRDHDRLDRVVAGTSDGILLLGRDGTVEVFNDALTRLTGIPGAAAVGQPVERVLAGVRLGAPIAGAWLLDDARPSSPTAVDQAQVRNLVDGTVRTVRESHTFRFEDGACVGDVVVITDVTREQEVADLKSDFIARVSHELRTPLTPIKGFATMLLRRGAEMDDEQRRLALERILERSDRMTSLVDDLLSVTELGDHEVVDDPASEGTVDLSALAHRVVLEAVPAPDGDRIRIDAAGAVSARGDEGRVGQVLRHLLDNAVRYSAPGTPVDVAISEADGQARVAVTDRGRGIPMTDQERVFEPFFRLEDPLRMTTSGVGVGLFIARRIAREMEGDVTVQSQHGEGSTFTLVLPLCHTASETMTAPHGPGETAHMT